MEKQSAVQNGNKTLLQVIFSSGSNPELALVVIERMGIQRQLIAGGHDFAFTVFFSISRKSRFVPPGKLTCKTNICFNKYTVVWASKIYGKSQ